MGRYPLNVKCWPFNPEPARVSRMLFGPGSGLTLIASSWALSTMVLPGSAIHGMPLSDNNPYEIPLSMRSRCASGSSLVFSPIWQKLISEKSPIYPHFLRNLREVRKSSQKKFFNVILISIVSLVRHSRFCSVLRGTGIKKSSPNSLKVFTNIESLVICCVIGVFF